MSPTCRDPVSGLTLHPNHATHTNRHLARGETQSSRAPDLVRLVERLSTRGIEGTPFLTGAAHPNASATRGDHRNASWSVRGAGQAPSLPPGVPGVYSRESPHSHALEGAAYTALANHHDSQFATLSAIDTRHDPLANYNQFTGGLRVDRRVYVNTGTSEDTTWTGSKVKQVTRERVERLGGEEELLIGHEEAYGLGGSFGNLFTGELGVPEMVGLGLGAYVIARGISVM